LFAVILVSAVARAVLVVSGGQFYWPDEKRYLASREMVTSILHGHPSAALAQLDSGDHVLFKTIGTIPAGIEAAVGQNPVIPALFFACFSVVNILLVWRLARRGGAAEHEALTAAALFAAANSAFYYARHLLPYDLAMTIGLLAVDVAQSSQRRNGLVCGLLGGLTFLTYAGYWTLAVAAVLVHALHQPSVRQRMRRAVAAGAAAMVPFLCAASVSAIGGGHLGPNAIAFAQTIVQGDNQEGWRLPFEYLWHAEHLLLLLWVICLAYCVWKWFSATVPSRVTVALAAVAAIYALLVLNSVVLGQFVVYGRLARQLVPFFAITAAYGLDRLRMSSFNWGRTVFGTIALVVCLQAIVNFSASLRLTFPEQFKRDGMMLVAGLPEDSYRWVNASHIYPGPARVSLPPYARVLSERPHPLNFLPYQFEGYTPSERRRLQAANLTMRLVLIELRLRPTTRAAAAQ
jgi:hypothetical protein